MFKIEKAWFLLIQWVAKSSEIEWKDDIYFNLLTIICSNFLTYDMINAYFYYIIFIKKYSEKDNQQKKSEIFKKRNFLSQAL